MSDAAPHLHVVADAVPAGDGLVDMIRRRFDGSYRMDPWGLDDDATRIAARIAGVRWSASVDGLANLPADGPALLVANRRLGWSEPVVVASSLLRDTGRVIRPVGGTDFDPLGGLLRRLGALPARPDEVAAALRAGNLVLVPTRREPVRNRPGHLPVELLAAAVEVGVPLVPVAVVGWEFGRRWQVRVGAPVAVDPLLAGGVGPSARGKAAKAKAATAAKAATGKGKAGKGKAAKGKVAKAEAAQPLDPADVARVVGAAAVDVAASLDAMVRELAEGDLGHRLLTAVPGVGDDDAAAGEAGAPGEWEGT